MDVPSHRHLQARATDLTTYVRIREAALEGFATKGIASTSIREVAAAAGVSPGLVQHHFGTKAGLRDAVNDYVIAVAEEALGDLFDSPATSAGWAVAGDTVTAFVRDHAVALRYVARALADGDADAGKIFDALVAIARQNWLQNLSQRDALHPDADLEWAALHAVVFNLASVLFEAAISHHLGEPLFSPNQLRRWNTATTQLYRHGLYRAPPSERRPTRR